MSITAAILHAAAPSCNEQNMDEVEYFFAHLVYSCLMC